MSDMDIFKEIEQDIAQEKLLTFWKKNQKLIVNAIVFVIFVAGAYTAWLSYVHHAQEKDALSFSYALDLAKDHKLSEAEAILTELKTKGSKGYAILARFKDASLALQKDKESGIKLYQNIVDDASVDMLFRNCARLILAYDYVDQMDHAAFEKFLQPLLEAQSSWKFTAMELAALSAQKNGALDQAKHYLNSIQEDADAPHAIRTRSGELLSLLNQH